MVSVLFKKDLLVLGPHEFQVLRKDRRSSVTRVALVGQQQHSLRRCFNELMNSFETTGGLHTTRKLATETSLSKGSVNNITDASGY
jgi:hypothetical protein